MKRFDVKKVSVPRDDHDGWDDHFLVVGRPDGAPRNRVIARCDDLESAERVAEALRAFSPVWP